MPTPGPSEQGIEAGHGSPQFPKPSLSHPAKHLVSVSLSQRVRQQRRQPGGRAHGAPSTTRLHAGTGAGLAERGDGQEEAPTFGRRSALGIRGFRAWFLRSVIGGGLQRRFWNIHSEPLRMAASPYPLFTSGGTQEQGLLEPKITQCGTQMGGRWPHDKTTKGPVPPPNTLCPSTRVIRQTRVRRRCPWRGEATPVSQPVVPAEARPSRPRARADAKDPSHVNLGPCLSLLEGCMGITAYR